MDLSFVDVKDGRSNGRFVEGWVRYQGRRHRVAVVAISGVRFQLTLSDTARCTTDLKAAEGTLRSLAWQAEVSDEGVEQCAVSLQAHCRMITGWQERKPRR